jgi:HlyD family secretion protein
MAQETTPNRRGWIIGIAAVVVLILISFWVRSALRTKVEVNVAQTSYQDIVTTESTNGQVVPVDDFQAYALAPGTVNRIWVKVGDKVSKGQELVQMDDSDAQNRLVGAEATLVTSEATLKNMQSGGTQDERLAQKADIAAAQDQVTQNQNALTALQALQTKGAASANEVESAKQKMQQAQAHFAQLQTRSTSRYGDTDLSAQQAQVANARESLSAARAALSGVDIRSPFPGTVYSVPVSAHDFVQTGEALLNVADLTRLKVKAYFDEPEVGSLRMGQKVSIVWDARPDRAWHGHIEQAPTTIIAYGTRHVGECIITVDDANGDLLPNTNVTATVTTNEKGHVLSIPREALHTEGQYNYVFKVAENHLQKTTVHVGALNLTLVEITSGLNDGDIVALGSATGSELTDGIEVVKAKQ